MERLRVCLWILLSIYLYADRLSLQKNDVEREKASSGASFQIGFDHTNCN